MFDRWFSLMRVSLLALPALISNWRLLCLEIDDSFGVDVSVSSAGDSYSSLSVDSSVSETVDLFDRFFGFWGSEDSESGSDFILTSLLFLLLRDFLVPWFVDTQGYLWLP